MPSPRSSRRQRSFGAEVPVRVSFTVESLGQGSAILEHLTEERLIAGGTVIEAIAVNWVGGDVRREKRLEFSAYTTVGKLPIIRSRVETFFVDTPPVISQFVMVGEKEQVLSWVERNVRK